MRNLFVETFATSMASTDESAMASAIWTSSGRSVGLGTRRSYQMIKEGTADVPRDDMRGAILALSAFMASDAPIDVTDVAREALRARVLRYFVEERPDMYEAYLVGDRAILADALRDAWFEADGIGTQWALARSFARYGLAPVEEVRQYVNDWAQEVSVADVRWILWPIGDLMHRNVLDRYWPVRPLHSRRIAIFKATPDVSGGQIMQFFGAELVFHMTMFATLDKKDSRELRKEGESYPQWRAVQEFVLCAQRWDEIELA